MTRAKRILPKSVKFRLIGLGETANRLQELIDNRNSETKLWIVCQKCARKVVSQANEHVDKSSRFRWNRLYSNGDFGGGKHFKRVVHGVAQGHGVRYGRLVDPYEKLQCQICGQRNEP